MYVKNNITGTFPMVIHAPDESDIWLRLCNDFFSGPITESDQDDRLGILTWNNFENSTLERCLDLRKIKYTVAGKDQLVWNNLRKFTYNLQFLESNDFPFVMGLDSHDVLVLGCPDQIVNRFLEMNCDLLFNCERYFYPNLDISYYQENKQFQEKIGGLNRYRFLNSGAWIGKREFCIKFFKECSKIRLWEMFDCTDNLKLFNCDQSVVHSVFKRYHSYVRLDYECRIFNNIALIENGEIKVVKLT